MHADLKPGGQFPDFELDDQDGKPARLSDLMTGMPTALTCNRGNY